MNLVCEEPARDKKETPKRKIVFFIFESVMYVKQAEQTVVPDFNDFLVKNFQSLLHRRSAGANNRGRQIICSFGAKILEIRSFSFYMFKRYI